MAINRRRAHSSEVLTLVHAPHGSGQKGADTKIELGFSMTLAGATPGIHPEGRRLGALRLGRRLETPKSQVWFLRITGEAETSDGFYGILIAPHAASGKYQALASYDAVRRHQNSGLRQKNSAPRASASSPAALFWELSRDRLWRAAARFGALP